MIERKNEYVHDDESWLESEFFHYLGEGDQRAHLKVLERVGEN